MVVAAPTGRGLGTVAAYEVFLLHSHPRERLRAPRREIHGIETVRNRFPLSGPVDRRKSRTGEVLLDVGALADDSGYLDLGVTLVSPDEDLLAYSVDTDRRRGLRAPLPRPAHRRRPRRGGAAQLLRRRLERRLAVVLLHRPRRGVPAARGVAAPARHPRRRRRAGAERAGRALRPERPGQPVRRRRAAARARAATPARRGSSTPTRPSRRRGRSAAAGPGVVYRAEHVRGRRRRRPAARHQRRRGGVPADAGARSRSTPTRTTRPGSRRGRRTRPSGWSGSTRSPGHVVLEPAHRRRAPAARRRARRPGRRGSGPAQPVRLRRGRPGAQHGVRRRRRSTVVDRAYAAAARLVRRRPRDRRRARTCTASEAPGHDPSALRDRADVPSPRRTAPRSAATAGPAPGHAARRDGPRAALRVRRLRGGRRAGVGPGAARACSTGASSGCTRTSAAAARAAGAGGSTGGSSTSSTRSTTTSPSPTGWRAGWSTATRIATRGLSAGGLLQGAVFSQRPDRWRAVWPRCRSSTW